MNLNTNQQKDLRTKLFQVKDIIGFPMNQQQKQQLIDITYILHELASEQERKHTVVSSFGTTSPRKTHVSGIDLAETSTNKAIALFEEYLNE